MKSYRTVLIAGILFLGGCSSIQVASNYDQSVDFTRFKTYEYYGWANNSDTLLTPFEKKLFEESFSQEFKKRGLTFVKQGGDLIVALNIVTEDKAETVIDTFDTGPGYGFGYGPGWRWGNSMATYHTYEYTVGTLVVDVYDTANQTLIWEGVGTKIVDEDPASRKEGIPAAVAAIMEQYPVKPDESE